MASYTNISNAVVASNQDAQNSYNQALANYHQESTATSKANADAQIHYNSEKANYDYLKSVYDSQIAEQQSITQHSIAISDAIKNAYSAAPAAYATNVQFSYEVLGSGTWNNDRVTYNHSHTVKMVDSMKIGEKKLSFDINVNGLKAGDKIHVLDLTMSSNNHQWDGLNDFMFLSRTLPFRINGVIYGYLQSNSYWGQNQNGGDQANVSNPYGNRNNNGAPHPTHELYIVMTKDYNGVGNQHISFDSETKNDLSEFNLEVGPSVFDTASGDINATLTATDHNGNVVNTTNFTFTRPTNKNDWNNGLPVFEDEHGLGMGDGQPHVAGFTNILVNNQYGDRWNTFTTSNAKYNIQNNYEFGGTYSRTGQTLINQMKPGDHGDRCPIDLGFETFDQDGRPLSRFRTVAASNSVWIPWRNVEYGLTVDQLRKKLDLNKSEIIYSYNPNNNSYSWIANVTKNFIQSVTKPILSNKENLLKRYPAWAWNLLVPADQRDKAIRNTIDFYNSHEWMPTHIGIWLADLQLVNPNEPDTLTGHIYSLNDPGGIWHDDYTDTEKNPHSSSLVSGQAGIHVHYVDSNGIALRQDEDNIDNANKTVDFTVQDIPGYTLDATDAKIPANSKTIEKSGEITYPGDGQWKDVYVVYKPFIPTGGLIPPTPPTLRPGTTEPPAPNLKPAPTKPNKEVVTRKVVQTSYHSNTVYRKNKKK